MTFGLLTLPSSKAGADEFGLFTVWPKSLLMWDSGNVHVVQAADRLIVTLTPGVDGLTPSETVWTSLSFNDQPIAAGTLERHWAKVTVEPEIDGHPERAVIEIYRGRASHAPVCGGFLTARTVRRFSWIVTVICPE